MASKWFEGCGDATQDITTFWKSAAGAVTVDTTIFNRVNGGSGAALRLDRTGANVSANIRTPAAVLADAGRRISIWFYFSQFPAATDDFIRLLTSGGVGIINIDLKSNGTIQVTQGGSTGATAMTPGTWNRITFSYTITNATTNSFKTYINGVLQTNDTNLVLTNTGSDTLLILGGSGSASFGQNFVAWFDDLYIDDVSDLSDPGDIRTTAKLPNSNNVNNYNTAVGANPANRWTNVNERPLSITNGWEDTQAGGGIIENYSIQGVSQGDVDISTYNQIAYMGWMWAKEGSVSGTPQLTVNGTDNAVTLTTSPALYTAITDSPAYPSNAAAIGQKSGTSASGTFLYECGIQIAYRWTPPASATVTVFNLTGTGP